MQSKKQNLEKGRRASLAVYMAVVTVVSLYAGLAIKRDPPLKAITIRYCYRGD